MQHAVAHPAELQTLMLPQRRATGLALRMYADNLNINNGIPGRAREPVFTHWRGFSGNA
jgi:hypothetical protein